MRRRAGDVPAGAVDTHVHVFDPARFPYDPGRGYTPGPATVETLAAFHRGLGLRRTVLVQPSPYGHDNAALLDGLDGLGRLGRTARGIAAVGDDLTDEEAASMRDRGVVGIRLNFGSGGDMGETGVGAVKTRLQAAADRGFLVEFSAPLPVLLGYVDLFAHARTPILLDHFAGVDAAQGVDQDGFDEVLSLVGEGLVWIKFSGQCRAAPAYPDRGGLSEVVQAFVAADAGRVVWGSDWPHTAGRAERGVGAIEPFQDVDDRADLAWLRDQLTSRQQTALFVANPSRLFGLP